MMVAGQTWPQFLLAASCLLAVVLMLRWARPVNGELSPKLRRPGMEALFTALTSMIALAGVGFMLVAIFGALR
jgi:hypothetical protein